tara:strand:+ start:268 stop:1566 length:1299 start_codon:yes stop_codon:yes gene_type:complete
VKSISIFWFRRDLRIEDNCGLFYALKENKNVLPIFIYDVNILKNFSNDDPRIEFIFNSLKLLDNIFKKNQSSIQIFKGEPEKIFRQLFIDYNINSVFFNRDYEPYAIERDEKIKKLLSSKQISVFDFKDHVVYEKNDVVKADGSPYKVYTPYSKLWLSKFFSESLERYKSENYLKNLLNFKNQNKITFESLGFKKSRIKISKYKIDLNLIDNYELTRNFPIFKTSKIGLYLRFGILSIRDVVRLASKSKNYTFLKELIWREFFIQILWHFPNTTKQSFKPKYDSIKWLNDSNKFDLWCQGKTGFPLVDAGMIQLNSSGFMHNRVRMLVGSFLCKHLLIDWRWGEAYFAKKLLDYEAASNIGNWQWVAGCGVDAAPYFRIFNPSEQIKKFDKEFKYIKKWIPDYDSKNYIKPIVDHKNARALCLKKYKEAINH